MNDLAMLYHELILDHCRHPRHFGVLDNATHSAHGYNPLCGDDVKVFLLLDNEKIAKIQFIGKGCAISLASASMMTVLLQNKSGAEAKQLFTLFHHLLTQDSPLPDTESLGKLTILANVKKYPMRVKCATLPWHTLKAALENEPTLVSTEKDYDD